jgi:hypothetical protein
MAANRALGFAPSAENVAKPFSDLVGNPVRRRVTGADESNAENVAGGVELPQELSPFRRLTPPRRPVQARSFATDCWGAVDHVSAACCAITAVTRHHRWPRAAASTRVWRAAISNSGR